MSDTNSLRTQQVKFEHVVCICNSGAAAWAGAQGCQVLSPLMVGAASLRRPVHPDRSCWQSSGLKLCGMTMEIRVDKVIILDPHLDNGTLAWDHIIPIHVSENYLKSLCIVCIGPMNLSAILQKTRTDIHSLIWKFVLPNLLFHQVLLFSKFAT